MKTVRFGDSTGMANPAQIMGSVAIIKELFPELTFNFHGHNTREMGLANVLAVLEAGITFFGFI